MNRQFEFVTSVMVAIMGAGILGFRRSIGRSWRAAAMRENPGTAASEKATILVATLVGCGLLVGGLLVLALDMWLR